MDNVCSRCRHTINQHYLIRKVKIEKAGKSQKNISKNAEINTFFNIRDSIFDLKIDYTDYNRKCQKNERQPCKNVAFSTKNMPLISLKSLISFRDGFLWMENLGQTVILVRKTFHPPNIKIFVYVWHWQCVFGRISVLSVKIRGLHE